jgi:hypothetical protein
MALWDRKHQLASWPCGIGILSEQSVQEEHLFFHLTKLLTSLMFKKDLF